MELRHLAPKVILIGQTALSYDALCYAQDSDYHNLIYEAKMTLLNGDCGGIFLRGDSTLGSAYVLSTCPGGPGSGTYYFTRYSKYENGPSQLRNNIPSSNIRTGRLAENTLAVQAEGNDFVLYVNGQRAIDHIYDGSSVSSTGYQIGVAASGNDRLAKVKFTDLHVWIL